MFLFLAFRFYFFEVMLELRREDDDSFISFSSAF